MKNIKNMKGLDLSKYDFSEEPSREELFIKDCKYLGTFLNIEFYLKW